MGTKADRDLWGRALAIETRYGDRALEVIARKIDELARAGQYSEAEFWGKVATCLTELHSIRWPCGMSEVTPAITDHDRSTTSRRPGVPRPPAMGAP